MALDRATHAAIDLGVTTTSAVPVAGARAQVTVLIPDADGTQIGDCIGNVTGTRMDFTGPTGRVVFYLSSVGELSLCAYVQVDPPEGLGASAATVTVPELNFRATEQGIDTLRVNVEVLWAPRPLIRAR